MSVRVDKGDHWIEYGNEFLRDMYETPFGKCFKPQGHYLMFYRVPGGWLATTQMVDESLIHVPEDPNNYKIIKKTP